MGNKTRCILRGKYAVAGRILVTCLVAFFRAKSWVLLSKLFCYSPSIKKSLPKRKEESLSIFYLGLIVVKNGSSKLEDK